MRASLFLFLLLSFPLAAQESERTNFFYMTNHLNVGNYVGWELGVNYVHRQKTTYRFSYIGNIRPAHSTPDDFSAGLLRGLAFGLAHPWDRFRTYQLGVGRLLPLNRSGSLRINFTLGLGYSIIREPRNWRREGNHLITGNYTWDRHKYNTMSLIINPSLEFPFTRSYGISLTPILQLSKHTNYIGVGIGHMIGPIRNRKAETD